MPLEKPLFGTSQARWQVYVLALVIVGALATIVYVLADNVLA